MIAKRRTDDSEMPSGRLTSEAVGPYKKETLKVKRRSKLIKR